MTNKQRQHLLAYLGYYVGTVDGAWGSGSREACKAFQRDMKIRDDGYGGPDTDKSLIYAVSNDLFKTEPIKEETGTFWDEIEYFDRTEFKCKCGGKYCNGFPAEPDETLVRLANDLRKQARSPAIPSSGLRCERWNAIQNGAATSRHKIGKALDFCIKDVSGSRLLAMAQADKRCRYAYIIDGAWVHIDVE